MLTNTTDIHNVSEEYKNDETSEAQAAKQTETEEKQNKQLKPGATKETWINQHAADKYSMIKYCVVVQENLMPSTNL